MRPAALLEALRLAPHCAGAARFARDAGLRAHTEQRQRLARSGFGQAALLDSGALRDEQVEVRHVGEDPQHQRFV
jgi:hypothetical protein